MGLKNTWEWFDDSGFYDGWGVRIVDKPDSAIYTRSRQDATRLARVLNNLERDLHDVKNADPA
jgi:hypothetical protein